MTGKAPLILATRLGLTCFLALLAGCDSKSTPSLSEAARTMQPSSQLITRCVGRYLIDLPAELKLHPDGGQMIDGVKLAVTRATAEEYRAALARRTAELDAAVVSRLGVQYPALRKSVPLPNRMVGILFDRAQLEGAAGRMDRVLEVLAWRDGYLLKAEIGGTDTTFPEDSANEALHRHLKTDVAEKSRLIIDVVSRTSGRPDHEIPSQQGTCIVNGFVRGTPTAGESIGTIYQFAGVDNLFMRISSTSLSRGKNTLLDRIETIRPLLQESDGKVFRKAKRDVAGMNGYETAYSFLSDENAAPNRVMIERYDFELNSAEGSARKPRFKVELANGESLAEDTGKEAGEILESAVPLKPAPLSRVVAEAMWDKIIQSVRTRPNAL